jgi:hypothetical protein
VIDVAFIVGNDTIKTFPMSSAPCEGAWVRIGGVLYVVAKVLHEYSATNDNFTAHVLIAPVPLDWLKGKTDENMG